MDPAAGTKRPGVLRGDPGARCPSVSCLAERVHGLLGAILPHTVRHPTITIDLLGLLRYYQTRYVGAMYSGSGGGYLYVVSEEPVPGGFQIKVRLA